MQQKIQGLQWKMNPAPPQPNPPMPWSQQQVVAEKLAKVRQNFRIARGMEPVAPVVHAHAFDLKTPGISAYRVSLFQDNGAALSRPCQLISRSRSGGTCTENHQVRVAATHEGRSVIRIGLSTGAISSLLMSWVLTNRRVPSLA